MTTGSLARFFHGKKALVTGHTGFKGSWLSFILHSFGADVSGYSLPPNTDPNLFTALGLGGLIRSHIADIRDFQRLKSIVDQEKPEIVLHLAAQPIVRASYDDPLYTFSTNVMGTANVLECVRMQKSVRSCLIVTTDKVYEPKDGTPHKEGDELGGHDPYGASKVCAEHVTRSYIRSFFDSGPSASPPRAFIASARAGNVIGGGDWSADRIVPDLVRAVLEKGEPAALRNPSFVRPWQHVLDPLLGYLILAKRLYERDPGAVGAWNFAPPEESFITVEELTKSMIRAMGKGSYSIRPDSQKHETGILKLDAEKALIGLGWKPSLGIRECISWTADWYSAYYTGKDMKDVSKRQLDMFLERGGYRRASDQT